MCVLVTRCFAHLCYPVSFVIMGVGTFGSARVALSFRFLTSLSKSLRFARLRRFVLIEVGTKNCKVCQIPVSPFWKHNMESIKLMKAIFGKTSFQ